MFKQELERGMVVKKHPRSGNPADRTWLKAMLPSSAFEPRLTTHAREHPQPVPAPSRHSTRALHASVGDGLDPTRARPLTFVRSLCSHTPCAAFSLLFSARSTVLSVCTPPRRRDVALPGADLLREARQVPPVRI